MQHEAIDELDNAYGDEGCEGANAYGWWLGEQMADHKIIYDDNLNTGEANPATGEIFIGVYANHGLFERIYLLVHEAEHIWRNEDHACEIGSGGCPRPGDEIDEAGLNCGNAMTGESRSWLL